MAIFPLVTHASNRYLVDSNGNPFPILGRTAWGLVSISSTLRASFLDDTVSHGFNAIECQIPDHLPNIGNDVFDGNGNLPFNNDLSAATWTGSFAGSLPDMTTPNSSYWTFVDGLVADCLSRNLLLLMFPAYLGIGGSEGWNDVMTANGTTNVQTYGAFVANRYKTQPHIVWMTAGDTASGFDNELALITGLKSVSGQASLHFSAERNGGSISSDGASTLGTTMTLNGAYDWATVIQQCQRAYSFGSIPAYLLEEPYDEEGADGTGVNNTFSTQPTRRYEWWGFLNTIGGYVAGNGYVWRFALSGTPLATDNYRNHLNTQATQDLGRLNALVKSINWWNLVPSGQASMRTLVASGSGAVDTATYIAAAQMANGTSMLVYYPPGASSSFTIDLRSMANKPIRARWWDPTAATFSTNASAAGTFTLANTASAQSFTPPATNSAGDKDFVLFLDTPNNATASVAWFHA